MQENKSLRQYIWEAKSEGRAVGHFNISNLEAFHGIVEASVELDLPVIIGVSEGEEEFVGREEVFALVQAMRKEGKKIFLNADHHYTFEHVKACIDTGFDAVIVDGAKLPFEENVALAKKCVEYARDVTTKTGRDIIVEGELGYIGQSSKILDGVPEGVLLDSLTTTEDAKRFVEETGVDMLAPAIGNIHGMMKGGVDPRLNIERIREIAEAVEIPLVLHGGSGNEADFKEAIAAGIAVVHINTELRVTYKEALEESLAEHPDEVAPYKILAPTVEAIKEKVIERLKLFSNID